MKDFIKMTLATLTGLVVFGVFSLFIMLAIIGAAVSIGEKEPVMPTECILKIDMAKMTLAEQTKEEDPMSVITGGGQSVTPVGIYSAIQAINKAAQDPAVKFIYLKPDAAAGSFAHLEELRIALDNFRKSGKAVVSYTENPGNGSYYLASVSDKIFMTSHQGGLNMLSGLSSQLIFLKDVLDRLGINVQLIRHGKYKSAGEMYIRNSASPENMEQNQEMIDSMWESWASQIAQSRGITVKELNAMLDNLKLNIPSDFIENGLVDELLTANELEQRLCDLYCTDDIKNVKSISLAEYAKLNNTANYKTDKKVAVIYAEGNIVDGNDKKQIAGDRFAKIISDVRKDSTIKAVVLRVNSPGGSVIASDKIKSELDLLQERVPVIASYGDYAASGGYWISANCDKIYSNATTLTGSIGVFSMIYDISGTLKNKLHVNVTHVKSNKHADMYSFMRPLDGSEKAYFQESVEVIYDQFTSLVAQGRDMSVSAVDNIAQGRVWTGAEALEMGLVDEIGTIEDAITYACLSIDGVDSVKDVQIVEYPKPQSTMDILLESLTEDKNVFSGTALEDVAEAFIGAKDDLNGKVYARMPFDMVVQ